MSQFMCKCNCWSYLQHTLNNPLLAQVLKGAPRWHVSLTPRDEWVNEGDKNAPPPYLSGASFPALLNEDASWTFAIFKQNYRTSDQAKKSRNPPFGSHVCLQDFQSREGQEIWVLRYGLTNQTKVSLADRDTFQFDQGYVTKNQPIAMLVLLSESIGNIKKMVGQVKSDSLDLSYKWGLLTANHVWEFSYWNNYFDNYMNRNQVKCSEVTTSPTLFDKWVGSLTSQHFLLS